MKISRFFAVIVAVGLTGVAHAGSGGGDPFGFLFIDANARAVGMGGAYTALANDSNALHYNPGGLGMIDRHEATFMHNNYFQGANQEYFGAVIRQGVGINFNYLKYGDFQRATYNNPAGSGLGTFPLNDLAFSAGYGHTIMPHLSLGGAIKYIRESIDNQSMNAVAFDVGAMYAMPVPVGGLSLGLAVQNIGPDARFEKVSNAGPRENLPLNVRGGAAYNFPLNYPDYGVALSNTVAVDLAKERNEDTVAMVGLESVVRGMAALRLGFTSRNSADVGISGGVGFVHKDVNVDYAIMPFGDLGYTHRVSVTVRIGPSATQGNKSGAGTLRWLNHPAALNR